MFNVQRIKYNSEKKRQSKKPAEKFAFPREALPSLLFVLKKRKQVNPRHNMLISKPFLQVESRNVGKRNTGCGSLGLLLFLPAQNPLIAP